MPYMEVGRVRHPESINLLWALRGLSLPPLVISGRWGGLCVGGRGSLKAACTLIGAGAIGALLALKYSPNSVFSSKFSSTIKRTPSPLSNESSTIQAEEELTVPGLLNAGNNCFLNVILQAVLHGAHTFKRRGLEWLVADIHKSLDKALASSKAVVSFMKACAEVNLNAEMNSIVTCNKDAVSMPLAISVSSLMKELSQLGEANRSSSPRRVMLALRSYVKHFDLASQQDAAEALVHLASAIQEERDNYIQWLKPTFQTFATASFILDQGIPCTGEEGLKHRREGDQLLESWRGHLHWPLEGTLASSLTCQRCAYQYTTQIQFFNDISLSPLQDRGGNIIQGCTLENCLEQFTGPEWIDNVKCSNCSHEAAVFSIYSIFRDSRSRTSKGPQSEQYTEVLQTNLKIIEECGCDDVCGCEALTRQQGGIWTDVHANASKQLKIGRCPEVVCFQLQRVVMSEDGALKKLTGHVIFPKVLDLFPFTIAAESSNQTRNNFTTKTYKGSLPSKSLQQGSRSSQAEDSHAAGPTSVLDTRLVFHEEAELGDKKSNDTTGILCLPQAPEICPADSTKSPTNCDLFSVAAVDEPWKQFKAPGEQLEFEQTSKRPGLSFEDFDSISPVLSTGSGTILTYSPLASSICSPYVPRVFPRHLQPWSLDTPQDGQHFAEFSSSTLGHMPALNSAPKNTNKSTTRSSKYSRRLLYELVSVVVHQGGPQSGHYIVYRKMIQPNCDEDLVFKGIHLPGDLADEPRREQKVETSASSGCIGDQGVTMWPGIDANKNQPVTCDQLELGALYDRTCGGENTLPIANIRDLEDKKLHGSQLPEEDTTRATENLVQGNGHVSREAKHGLDRLGATDKLIPLWFRVSDTHVQRVPEQEVFSAHASLLFYEQL